MARKSKSSSTKPYVAAQAAPTSRTPPTSATATRDSAVSVDSSGNRKALFSFNTQKAINILALAAIYAPLSQLILSPVYGSIPSAKYHKYIVTGAPLLAYTLLPILPKWFERLIPVLAFWIPSIHLFLFPLSGQLAEFGPLVTELLTAFPLITLSNYMAMKLMQDVDIPAVGNSEAGPPMIIYALFTIFQRLMKNVLPPIMGRGIVFTRVGLQLLIATIYGLVLPQSLFWPAFPSVIITMLANPHLQLERSTDVAKNTLAMYNYTLLDRQDSLTGYISVLEDNNMKFRVLRCDHSLLGGEWQFPTKEGVVQSVKEPIYAVFTMLEAVRLIEPPKSLPSPPADKDKRALTIGLGIGTAPAAFIAHGIHTTVLELDPAVHYFARKYFSLPLNHSYYIGDAIDFVHGRSNQIQSLNPSQQPNSKSAPSPSPTSDTKTETDSKTQIQALQYDYIIHDTFTGGALPIPLFTRSFLQSLASLLKPTGAITINYAGDLDLPSASLVYRTIKSVFPTCKIYREDDPASTPHSDTSAESGSNDHRKVYQGDFTNLVYFCVSPLAPASHQIKFRQPIAADFLDSQARRAFMLPKYELDVREKFGEGDDGDDDDADGDRPQVLDVNDAKSVRLVERYQAQSAMGHWKLMRTVIPPQVWETW